MMSAHLDPDNEDALAVNSSETDLTPQIDPAIEEVVIEDVDVVLLDDDQDEGETPSASAEAETIAAIEESDETAPAEEADDEDAAASEESALSDALESVAEDDSEQLELALELNLGLKPESESETATTAAPYEETTTDEEAADDEESVDEEATDQDTDESQEEADADDSSAETEDIPEEEPLAKPAAQSAKSSPADDKLRLCEQAVGYTFFDKKLIKNALTHSSSTSDKRLDNERLEFFGDAVLDLIIREYLYHNYPNHQEGDLTEAKSSVVCRASLAKASKRMELKSFLFLGRGIGKKRAVPDSLLADAYEAIVAAIYLDGGYQPAKNFVLMTLRDEIPGAMQAANSTNYKSNLQKYLQQQKRPLPIYKVLGSTGPEHSRVFEVAAFIEGEEMGRGSGSSKKAAEQEAARIAMDKLEVDSE